MKFMEKEIKIRDLRKKDQYKIDDAYLNGYARLCGVYATAVYNSLSRHADFHSQECFPSIEMIANQHGIDKKKVIDGLNILINANIINKTKEKDPKTKRQLPNVYILLDKSQWVKKENIIPQKNKRGSKNSRDNLGKFRSRVDDMDTESRVDDTAKSRVDDMDCKDNTKEKDNTLNPAKQSFAKEINSFLFLFKEINPSYERLFSNKTQRGAIERMLKKFGREKLEATIKALPEIINQPYAPKITTPYELERDLGKLVAFYKQNNNKITNIIL